MITTCVNLGRKANLIVSYFCRKEAEEKGRHNEIWNKWSNDLDDSQGLFDGMSFTRMTVCALQQMHKNHQNSSASGYSTLVFKIQL